MEATKYAGSKHDLPPDIAAVLTDSEKMRVEYWSRPDSSQPLVKSLYCNFFAPALVLPCVWPHVLLGCGPILCYLTSARRSYMARVVVVTDRTVELITLPHEVCCIPGCCRTPVVKTSLRKGGIATVTIDDETNCLCRPCLNVTQMSVLHGTMVGKFSRVSGKTVLHAHPNMTTLKEHIMRVGGPPDGTVVVRPCRTREWDDYQHSGLETTHGGLGNPHYTSTFDTGSFHQQSHFSGGGFQESYTTTSAFDTGSCQHDYNF